MFFLQKKQTVNMLALGFCLLLVFTAAHFFSAMLLRVVPLHFSRAGDYAVFLANGQVYFGSLMGETERSIVLADIYYLKATRPLLTQDDLQSESDASLIKLGNELHGPEDRMEINRAHVLFIEKLRPDGKVAKAIAQYRGEKK